MAQVLQLKGQSTTLSDTPTNLGEANRVLLQHNHASGNSHLVTLKDDTGSVIGSLLVHPSEDAIIQKYKTDTIEVGSNVSDVVATAVGVVG